MNPRVQHNITSLYSFYPFLSSVFPTSVNSSSPFFLYLLCSSLSILLSLLSSFLSNSFPCFQSYSVPSIFLSFPSYSLPSSLCFFPFLLLSFLSYSFPSFLLFFFLFYLSFSSFLVIPVLPLFISFLNYFFSLPFYPVTLLFFHGYLLPSFLIIKKLKL